MWFIIGGASFMLAALLSDSSLKGKYSVMFLAGAAMFIIGVSSH